MTAILVQCGWYAIGMRRKHLSCNFFFRSKYFCVKLRHADEKLIFGAGAGEKYFSSSSTKKNI